MVKKDTSINIKCDKHLKKLAMEEAERQKMTFSDWLRWMIRKEVTKGD